MLTAAFTIVGAITVSAQATPKKPAENSKTQPTTQTQPTDSAVGSKSPGQNNNTTEMTTSDSVAVPANTETKPKEVVKEGQKAKKKSK